MWDVRDDLFPRRENNACFLFPHCVNCIHEQGAQAHGGKPITPDGETKMNFINASDFGSAYDAYKSAKFHPMMVNESTTIVCDNVQYSEIIEATSDEDCEGYAEIEGGADIWGAMRTQMGEVEFRVYLKIEE